MKNSNQKIQLSMRKENKKNELLHNEQYHVAPRSFEEVEILVETLKKKGYKILHGLDNRLSMKQVPVGICIDNGINPKNGGKCVFKSNVTCMACYCMWSKKEALRVEDIINNIEKLIDNPDIEFYNELLDKRTISERNERSQNNMSTDEATSKYEISIILNKKEISEDFLVVAWKEEFVGTKKAAIERAKQLQKEWKAELFEVKEVKRNSPKILIMSRSQIERLIDKRKINKQTAVVSFADTKDDFIDFPNEIDVLLIDFYDLSPYSIPSNEYDKVLPQAKKIAIYVKEKIKEGKNIICQCDYGVSRSAGLAAAIYEWLDGKGIEIFADYRYSPNRFVFNKVLKELIGLGHQ